MSPADPSLPLLKGTLELLLLKALQWGPMHGFALSQWLEERSRGEMSFDDSALYHALHRLEGRGAISGSWAVTENGRKARYYRLTAAGTRRLRDEADTWTRYARLVGRILALQP
ncbi:MAG: PadR family transcriptional regulator [Gemmatimonadales bacterium]